MTDIKKRIADFTAIANEKSLNRILQVIEHVESPVAGYTHTGEPVLMEEIVNNEAANTGENVEG